MSLSAAPPAHAHPSSTGPARPSSLARPARFLNTSPLIPLHNTLNRMPSYRCYFLDGENRIKDATDLEANALAAAIDQALALLRERSEHDAIEI